MQQDVRHRNTLPEHYNQAADTWIDAPKEMALPSRPAAACATCLCAGGHASGREHVLRHADARRLATAASGDGTYPVPATTR